MRIVLLLTAGIDRPIGARYLPICRELIRQGHQVRILALHPDFANCTQRRFIRDGIEVWYVGQMHARKIGSTTKSFSPLALLQVLIRSTLGMIWGIICSPADIYHLGKPQPINGLAAILGVMLLRGKRFYVDCDDDEVASNRLTAKWQRQVFAFWQNLLPRLAAGVTVNTQFLLQRLQQQDVKRIAYVPNGTPEATTALEPLKQQALQQSLGLGSQVIAYVGTLALHNHPVDILIDAFTLIAPQHPQAQLLLIGGGEDLEHLRNVVAHRGLADRVYFTGQLARHVTAHYLRLSCVTVDPVRDDVVARARSPLKIFESMALGIPVITGDVGDRALMLNYGQAGILVPADDAQALAQALNNVLSDQNYQQNLAQAAYQQSQHYRWDIVAKAWLDLYQ